MSLRKLNAMSAIQDALSFVKELDLMAIKRLITHKLNGSSSPRAVSCVFTLFVSMLTPERK